MNYSFELSAKETNKDLYQEALIIINLLKEKGHITYMAGGCVRDWLLNRNPDDLDLATSAPAELVCSLFEKTIRTGIQFESVRVIQKGKPIEVSSFRQDGFYKDGRRPIFVQPTSPERDAQRRDFTINGLFYCPLTYTVFDYIEGHQDLIRKIVRTIGDPYSRFEEDHLRLIRAVRLASKLQYDIDHITYEAIEALSDKICSVSKERIHDELTKICSNQYAAQAFSLLLKTGLLEAIFKGLCSSPIQLKWERFKGPFALWPICLLIISNETLLLSNESMYAVEKKLCLSKKERNGLFFGKKFGEAAQKDPTFSNLPLWCRFLSSPFYEELYPFLSKEYQNILSQISLSRGKLIQALKERKTLLSGEIFQKIGIRGPLCGQLLEKATDLAIHYNSLEENEILNLLYKKGWIQRPIC